MRRPASGRDTEPKHGTAAAAQTATRLIAVREDGEQVRHDSYSAEFARLRDRAGLSEVSLKRLRNTSVSLMMDRNIPVHIVAAWHGHDPAVSLSIYADAKQDELRAAGAALFG